MIGLWDTTGNEVVKALAAERRSAGGVASGMALTLIVVVDEKRVREAEAAATIAAAAHPCRLLVVVRSELERDRSRLDAEIVVGGRLGPCEAVVHADVRPAGPARRVGGDAAAGAGRAGGDLVARRAAGRRSPTTSSAWWPIAGSPTRAQAPDPIAALRLRAEDYAPGDTDLAWTRITPWRTLVAGAFDTTDARGHRRDGRRPGRATRPRR